MNQLSFSPNKKKGFLTTSQGNQDFYFLNFTWFSQAQEHSVIFNCFSQLFLIFLKSKVLSQMGNSQGVDFNPGISNGDTQQFVR
jgi:hypothetical protein